MSKQVLFAALLALLVVPGALADDKDLGFTGKNELPTEMYELPRDISPQPDTVIMVDKPTLDKVVAAATRDWEVGGRNVFVVDLQVGLTTGLRIQVIPWGRQRVHLVLEAFLYGAGNGAGLGAEYGGGARVELVVASDHKYNALYISPGVDFQMMPGDPSSGIWFHFAPYSNVYILSATADISWVHEFAPHFSWQVIGARLGGGIGLSGETANQRDARGMFLPEISLFTGFRF
jgi:hypothetical protein